jgi:leader peptidase (prepilin peptidase) / N-methyltransferase
LALLLTLSTDELRYGSAFFIFGLAFGSFLNVCIHRLPRGLSIVFPASTCPSCGKPISAYDNIPVISWLVLHGKCRQCGSAITIRYVLVELLTALLFLASYWQFGANVAAIKYCIFSFLLIGLIFTDAELKLLPDAFTLPGIALGLLLSFFVPVEPFLAILLPQQGLGIPPHFEWRLLSFADALLSAVIAAGFIWTVGAVWTRFRGVEAMGFGDVKLMAMVGTFVGLKFALLTILFGSLIGSIAGLAIVASVWLKRLRRYASTRRAFASAQNVLRFYQLPFGVFLGAAALAAVFFGHRTLAWYWSLYL